MTCGVAWCKAVSREGFKLVKVPAGARNAHIRKKWLVRMERSDLIRKRPIREETDQAASSGEQGEVQLRDDGGAVDENEADAPVPAADPDEQTDATQSDEEALSDKEVSRSLESEQFGFVLA